MLFEETFDGLADETAVTSTNTTLSDVLLTGTGAAVADTAFSVAGGVSTRVSTTVDGDFVRMVPAHTVSDPIAIRFYFRPDAYPSTGVEGETNIAEARTSLNAVRAMMEFVETGEIGIKDKNTLVGTSTTTLPVGQWSRIEWKLDATADTQTCRLFIGANLHGTVPDEEFSGAYTLNGDISTWWLGQVRKTFAMTAWWDEIAIAADWPGPAVISPTTLIDWTTGPLPSTAGSTVVLDTVAGFPSPDAISIQQAASSQAYAYWNAGAATTALRFYIKTPSAWSTTSSQIAGMGGTAVAEYRVNLGGSGSPGQIRLVTVAGATVAQSTTGVIAVDTWYRVEVQADTSASQARLAVFPVGSTTALWNSGWQANANFTTVPTRVAVGRTAATPTLGTFLIDSVFATTDVVNWIGPVAGDNPPAVTVEVWDGSALQPVASVGVWNGTSLQSINDITVV